MADTRYWIGGAVAVPEVKAYIFAGTWAGADWASITINGKTLTLTLTAGDTMTVTAVAAAMIDMINGAAANENEVRSALGASIGEFAILTASAGSAGQVLITGPSNGRPIGTVTLDSLTTGDGTWAAVAPGLPNVTGTGPNHWSNNGNWSTAAAIPVATDLLVFDHRAMSSPMFDIVSAYAPGSILITEGFRYALGLPAVNTDNPSTPFGEHQSQYVSFTSCADVRVNATNALSIRLDLGSAASTVVVENTGRTSETGIPPLLLKVNHSSSAVTINNGTVGICHESTTAGSVGTLTIGGSGSPAVTVGNTVTLATILVESGTALLQTAFTTLTINGGSVEHSGGAINSTVVYVNGGTFYPKTVATYSVMNQGAGTVDCTKDSRKSRTFSIYNMYGGALKDPAGTIIYSDGLKVFPKLSSVSLDMPTTRRYTISTI